MKETQGPETVKKNTPQPGGKTSKAAPKQKTVSSSEPSALKTAVTKARAKSQKVSVGKTPVKDASLQAKKTPEPQSGGADQAALALAKRIAGYLDEKKAQDIVLIHIGAKTVIADYFVIASARSTTAVKALSEYVDEKLSKDHRIEPLRRDIDAKWYAIDYGSVILHIFYEETRSFYGLERLWTDGDNLERV